MDKLLKSINKNIDKYLERLKEKDIEKVIKNASDLYYNDEAVLDDDVFDILVERLRQINPTNKILKEIGAPIREDIIKVELPAWMGSLDKIKPGSRELELWFEKYQGPYFISQKLDGISGLIMYDKSGNISIYTRGNGSIGQDISFLKDDLKIPRLKEEICIRGEFILKKLIFYNKYTKFPKARSVVSGVINSKKPDPEILSDIDFLGYEIVKSRGDSWSNQFSKMKRLGFEVSEHSVHKKLDSDTLKKLYLEQKTDSIYEIDGLVVAENSSYLRNKSGNPKYAVAFKVNTEGINTKILEVEWSATKYGVLKPRVRIEPVIIDGDTVQYATAFNAKYIEENKIGPGTIIKIIKSGDVIPYILSIVKPTKAYFPKIDYVWNETHVDILLKNPEENTQVSIRRLLHVFNAYKIPSVSIGVVTKLYEAGYNNFDEIYQMEVDDFLEIPTFKEKMSEKIYNSIHSILDNPIPLETIMSASLVFDQGFGEKKFSLIIDKFPNILKDYKKITVEDIISIDGFSDKTAIPFVEKLPLFIKFMEENDYLKVKKPGKKHVGNLTGVNYAFTGFRDQKLKDEIEAKGGKVSDTVSSKTNVLIYKSDEDFQKSKGQKAKKLGIKTVKKEDFKI